MLRCRDACLARRHASDGTRDNGPSLELLHRARGRGRCRMGCERRRHLGETSGVFFRQFKNGAMMGMRR